MARVALPSLDCRKRRLPLLKAALLIALLAAFGGTALAQPLVLERRIELPQVKGRIDHLAIDVEGRRLFVAALGSDSLEVVDLRAAKRVARITSLHEPQGVLYLVRSKRLLVANGAEGGVQVYSDLAAPAIATQAALDDADNLRVDPTSGEVVVGFAKALAWLDPDTLRVTRKAELVGHPESFQIEPLGQRIYVNVPSASQVAVIDRKSGKIQATWRLEGSAGNFPMALDEGKHRLFVVTRRPPQLLVLNTQSGNRLARADVCGDADDVFMDDARQQLYVVCGEGRIDVVRVSDNQYRVVFQVPTAPGARTGLFEPSLSTLFVAVPAKGGSPAEIRAYAVR